MLRADARQHAVTRMHQSTQFLDIPDMPCAHFRHEHLRRGRQALTDDFVTPIGVLKLLGVISV